MSLDPGPFSLGPVGGEGPAVLCLHGLTGMPYEVRPPAEALAARGFACLGPLLPGHGTDPEDLARTPREAWLRTGRDALDTLGASHARVYLLGLSLGGLIALRLAAERRIDGLLVLAAPLDLGAIVRFAASRLARWVPFLPKRAAIRDPEARRRHPCYARMPLRAVHELIQLQAEVRESLDRVSAPIRLLYSRRDPTVRLRDAEEILAKVRSADRALWPLEGSWHVLPVDVEREEVASRCVAFLAGLEQAGR